MIAGAGAGGVGVVEEIVGGRDGKLGLEEVSLLMVVVVVVGWCSS